ncbi:DMT family transporter [Propionispora hippei]|uniref:EamA domain-containing membrane protein RarD n=1 Tax=Propionispora hippei DSM 15287 TaxID=1123003 RepID=A0A1M6DMR8_9FIRM|nr:EamA family transporter [Propionispora hippei]SHI74278.1 EamA domain-containing membrane protein RarD [Propionispora hippei DSM 15287]
MKDQLKFITAMLVFGTIGVFVKNINLPSLDIAFLRAIIGCVFLICAGFMMGQTFSPMLVKKNIRILLLSGAAIGFNWLFLFQAYKYTTIANATLSYYFAPMFVMMLSPLILKERLTMIKIGCISAALAGLFMILNGDNSATLSNTHLVGIGYGLAAAALYASVILMNKFIKGLSGFETTLIQLFMAGLVLLPSLFYNQGIPLASLNGQVVLLILVVGIIHTGLAYLIYFTSMKEIKGQTIAILSYIDPVTAVFLSAVLLGEAMTYSQIIGGILILGSTFLSETGEGLIQKITKSV